MTADHEPALIADDVRPLGEPHEVFNPETKQFERNPQHAESVVAVIAETVAGSRWLEPSPSQVVLAQTVVEALDRAGFTIIRSDSWRLRSDFDVVPHSDGREAPE